MWILYMAWGSSGEINWQIDVECWEEATVRLITTEMPSDSEGIQCSTRLHSSAPGRSFIQEISYYQSSNNDQFYGWIPVFLKCRKSIARW